MDEQTEATVRALLDRHPRGYVQEEAGFTVTKSAAGLFRLLVLSVLADDNAPSPEAVEGTKALLARRWDSVDIGQDVAGGAGRGAEIGQLSGAGEG